MIDDKVLVIAAVFVLAGVVKGVIGLGLPTISMGLLALVMAPLQAAAIVVLPSFLTNVWQMMAGPSLGVLVRRLWPLLVGVCLGTWAGAGLMTGIAARYGNGLLGAALLIYAAMGLGSFQISIARARERWLGPAAGALTGLISAATGVFVVPTAPYLQAMGLDKEDLVQAMGLAYTVSTLALAVNLWLAGALNIAMAGPTLIALAAACGGMWIGQMLRLRLRPTTFRHCFFGGLLLLGAYLVIDALR
jgi:uncharacterized protein